MFDDKDTVKNLIITDGKYDLSLIDQFIPIYIGKNIIEVFEREKKNLNDLFSASRILLSSSEVGTIIKGDHLFNDVEVKKSNSLISTESTTADLILDLFSSASYGLPLIKPYKLYDWPFLICAQIQLICETKQICPSEALAIFGITFDNSCPDSWDSFPWKYSIETYIDVILRKPIILEH